AARGSKCAAYGAGRTGRSIRPRAAGSSCSPSAEARMLDRPGLMARLGDLVRSRRASDGAPPAARAAVAVAPVTRVAAIGVEEYLPGGEWRDARGTVYVHERLRSQIERPAPHWGRLERAPEHEPEIAALAAQGLERALFLDLETGGFASSPVFLAGTMHWNGSDFVVRQYFARHYGEEAT